ncbi:NAD(P)-dependent oxidoreductase [Afifella pfennigii]|uniref:NAD(P)-dependent oxidoreductase n=1 Tax=Afifella pfennigii TaxID=209897 RepID=UPI00068F33D4|nr:NAD(P)-dependent oxidoreductase [Afifella pfennigii]
MAETSMPHAQTKPGIRLERVGFVGLGRMGNPMAQHIAEAGLPLTVFDLSREAIDRFCCERRARPARSLPDLAANADIVVLMLPTSREVRAVLMGESGEDGLAARLAPGSLVVDSSSSDPLETRALGETLAKRSLVMVDAPVAGGVVFAKDGTLDILLGGTRDAIARAHPVVTCFGERLFPCGPLGAGHAMKVLNNFVNAEALITYAEALTVGLKFGLDLQVMMEALTSATTGRNHPLEKKIGRQVLTRDFATGMALSLIAKDVRLARGLADGVGMEAPVMASCLQLWQRGSKEIGAAVDQSEIVKLWEREAGLTIAPQRASEGRGVTDD